MDDTNAILAAELCLISKYASCTFLSQLIIMNLPLDLLGFLNCLMTTTVTYCLLMVLEFGVVRPEGFPVETVRWLANLGFFIASTIVAKFFMSLLEISLFESGRVFCLQNVNWSSFGYWAGGYFILIAIFFISCTTVAFIRLGHLSLVILKCFLFQCFAKL